MCRVFEALDELGAIVEEARGVPMTAGCVVPRGDVLELIDDIKDAIPGELDDAQDVLDARDQLLNEAKDHSGSMVATARAEADSMLNHARTRPTGCWPTPRRRPTAWSPRARRHSERIGRGGPVRKPPPYLRDGGAEYEASGWSRRGSRGRPPDRERQPLLREGRTGGHQGTAAPCLADRDRPGGERSPPAHRRRLMPRPNGCAASATSTSTASSLSSEEFLNGTLRSVGRGRHQLPLLPACARHATR